MYEYSACLSSVCLSRVRVSQCHARALNGQAFENKRIRHYGKVNGGSAFKRLCCEFNTTIGGAYANKLKDNVCRAADSVIGTHLLFCKIIFKYSYHVSLNVYSSQGAPKDKPTLALSPEEAEVRPHIFSKCQCINLHTVTTANNNANAKYVFCTCCEVSGTGQPSPKQYIFTLICIRQIGKQVLLKPNQSLRQWQQSCGQHHLY